VNLIEELQAIQRTRGHLGEPELRELAERLRVPLCEIEGISSFYPHLHRAPPSAIRLSACRDLSCRLRGGEESAARLAALCADREDIAFERVSCLGRCDRAPACTANGVPLRAEDLPELLEHPERPPAEAASPPPRRWQIDPYASTQEHYGILRSTIQAGGPEQREDGVIARLENAGLRGMGGAGFSTGRKWRLVRAASEATKYVVCNADESEPGTFKDRVILEELPHLVIEGTILAALSVGARRGWVFIRHEYRRERATLERAIDAAYRAGVLGERVCGSDFRFELEVFVSPGGYILGEETALLEALEGRRGEPRNRPPFPGARGLRGKPTLINNVETLAQVPHVLQTGVAELKFFSVSGDVEQPGVHEVPLGTTARELIARCGGMRDGAALLAFLPGGASSGFLPAERVDVALDWDSLREAGSAMGSGAVVIVSEGADLLALAHNLTAFFRNESCGKCVPCRLGTEQALRLIEAGSAADLARIPELHEVLRATSLCGLGQVALLPVSSVLERFPELVRQKAAERIR
jgi:NADH:ubiquinone oxidoreductase subunit F (NADH-binding)/NADH:ubiquinone oxidoreductase subunit E